MYETLTWLRSMEGLACEAYRSAAAAYGDDRELCAFLKSLADDEAWHGEILEEAMRCAANSLTEVELAVDIDAASRERLAKPLHEMRALLESGRVPSVEIVLEQVVNVEYSELNDVFSYVVTSFGRTEKTFQLVAATVDAHERRIAGFLENHPSGNGLLDRARELPSVWTPHVLVVEDSRPVAELFAAIMRVEGRVDIAENGRVALDRIRERFYNLVLCDLRMPVMDGPAFFEEALKEDPTLPGRLVFCTGEPTDKLHELVIKYGVPWLQKPIPISALQDMLRKKLLQQH